MTKDVNLHNVELENSVDFIEKHYFQRFLVAFLFLLMAFAFSVLVLTKIKANPKTFQNELNNKISKILLRNSTGNDTIPEILFNKNAQLKFFPLPHILLTDVEGRQLGQGNYRLDFKIKQAKLYISLKNIILAKFRIRNINVEQSNFVLTENQNNTENNVINKLFESVDNENKIKLKNSSLLIKNINSDMELTDMNLNLVVSSENVDIKGKLNSNKQPLEIKAEYSKNKNNNIKTSIDFDSLAFNGDIKINGNAEKKEYSGQINFNINSPQIFARTLFFKNTFIYQRLIDNSDLKLNSMFSFKDNIFEVKNINFIGNNINGGGSLIFDFNENKTNKVNFNINNVNLDALIIKNFVGENNFNQNDITIFENKQLLPPKEKYENKIVKSLKLNPTTFDIKAKSITINNNQLKNAELDFNYSKTNGIEILKAVALLPNNVYFSITNENDTQKLLIKGQNFKKFLSFVRNIKYYGEDNTSEFSFDGDISFKNDRIFIKNSTFATKDLNAKNEIEVKFDKGVSFVALNSNIDNLNLNNFNFEKDRVNILKNRALFLNNFNINTILNLSIENLNFKDFQQKNSKLKIRLSSGKLDIFNINLDNKIFGDIYLDILPAQPILNISLQLENTSFDKNINISNLLFNYPSLDDFYGKILIIGRNLLYKNQLINDLKINSNIENGIIKIQNFSIDGFGGKCGIGGYFEYSFNKKINLTLNGCTANIKNILGALNNTENIEGLIGFSSVLYAEGQSKDLFNRSWVMKTQLVGSGITINNYGLAKLSSDLFKIQSDVELLKIINPQEILENKEEKTIFEKLSGNIQHTNTNNGQFSIDLSRPLINGKLFGTFDFKNNEFNYDMDANFILISGTLQKTIPLTILTKITKIAGNSIVINTNLKQVNEYVEALRNSLKI